MDTQATDQPLHAAVSHRNIVPSAKPHPSVKTRILQRGMQTTNGTQSSRMNERTVIQLDAGESMHIHAPSAQARHLHTPLLKAPLVPRAALPERPVLGVLSDLHDT